MSDLVLRQDEGPVATLTLNNPAKLNALSCAMLGALHDALDEIALNRDIRVIILRGAGRAFCAGHDLRELADARQAPDGGRRFFDDLFARCGRMMVAITRQPQPVIAQVQGVAAAAGCQLVASCDMAIAAEDCRFGVNGVDIGFFCSTPMVALSRNIPRKQAFEMLTTGEFVSAARAVELGLINRAVPADAVAAESAALAGRVAGKLSAAVRIGKEAFYAQAEMTLDAAYAYTGRVASENLMWRDTAEGIAAFVEKRDPDWAQ
ncbi:MAG: enoyl-CoA hydratase [Pseudomonadota bacterium]